MSPTEFMRTYETVTNAHDLDVLLELIADDAIYLFSNQTSHIGKDAIRGAIQAVIRRVGGRWKVAHEHLSSGGLGGQ